MYLYSYALAHMYVYAYTCIHIDKYEDMLMMIFTYNIKHRLL